MTNEKRPRRKKRGRITTKTVKTPVANNILVANTLPEHAISEEDFIKLNNPHYIDDGKIKYTAYSHNVNTPITTTQLVGDKYIDTLRANTVDTIIKKEQFKVVESIHNANNPKEEKIDLADDEENLKAERMLKIFSYSVVGLFAIAVGVLLMEIFK